MWHAKLHVCPLMLTLSNQLILLLALSFNFRSLTIFRSPEIASQNAHGRPVDIWSVGCLFYLMIVGKAPFEDIDVKVTLKR